MSKLYPTDTEASFYRDGYTRGYADAKNIARYEARLYTFAAIRAALTIARTERIVGNVKTIPFTTRFPHYYAGGAIRRAIRNALKAARQHD